MDDASVSWVLATGSRAYRDRLRVRETLVAVRERHPGAQLGVTHGAAAGLDTLIGEEAALLGWVVDPVPCTKEDWRRFGKAAGHRRNAVMVARHEYIGCVAFPVGLSAGTRGCVALAADAGIPVWNRGDPPLPDGVYRVVSGSVCAGFEVSRGVVVRCAPVLRRDLARWWDRAMDLGDTAITRV